MAYPDSAGNAAVITPSNSTTIPPTLGIYVGGAGNITVDFTTQGQGTGTNITLTAVPVGVILPIRVTKVYATGTTATLLVALY